MDFGDLQPLTLPAVAVLLLSGQMLLGRGELLLVLLRVSVVVVSLPFGSCD